MHFKSIFRRINGLSQSQTPKLSVLHRNGIHFGGKNLCQVYFMLMKLRSLFDGYKKCHQMCTTVYAFRLNMGKARRQCLDIGIKTWQVHEHSGLFFHRVIYLLFFFEFEALLTVCYHIVTVFPPMRSDYTPINVTCADFGQALFFYLGAMNV